MNTQSQLEKSGFSGTDKLAHYVATFHSDYQGSAKFNTTSIASTLWKNTKAYIHKNDVTQQQNSRYYIDMAHTALIKKKPPIPAGFSFSDLESIHNGHISDSHNHQDTVIICH